MAEQVPVQRGPKLAEVAAGVQQRITEIEDAMFAAQDERDRLRQELALEKRDNDRLRSQLEKQTAELKRELAISEKERERLVMVQTTIKTQFHTSMEIVLNALRTMDQETSMLAKFKPKEPVVRNMVRAVNPVADDGEKVPEYLTRKVNETANP